MIYCSEKKKKNIGDNHKYFQITTQGSQSSQEGGSHTRKLERVRKSD